MASQFSLQTARGRAAAAASGPRELSRQLACNRRDFLRTRGRPGAGERDAGPERDGAGPGAA